MCRCACHLSAALWLSGFRLSDGSGRQWRQRTTRLWPTCDYCSGGAQKGRVRTRCKQYTEPQTTFSGWSTSREEAWGLAARGLMLSGLCQMSGEDRCHMNLVRMLETSSASFCLALPLTQFCMTIHPTDCQTDQTAAIRLTCSGACARS